jgi:hypothetical protein
MVGKIVIWSGKCPTVIHEYDLQFDKRLQAGTPELGGRRGSRPRCSLPGEARGAKVPFQFKVFVRNVIANSELSEMLVQFFNEFASENARNAVIELQE